MKIVLHLGAHCTDSAFLLRCLRRNERALRKAGVLVPPPDHYRPRLKRALEEWGKAPAEQAKQSKLLADIVGERPPDVLVLSWEDALCVPQHVVRGRHLYPMIAQKAAQLARLMTGAELRFAMAMRNPATFIPALHGKLRSQTPFKSFAERADLKALRWSETAETLLSAVPNADLLTWCHEDSALLWGTVMNAVVGEDRGPIGGGQAFAVRLMTDEGAADVENMIKAQPDLAPSEQAALAATHLDRHARPDVLETETDLPGWDARTVFDLTQGYEEDMTRLAGLRNVRHLTPETDKA